MNFELNKIKIVESFSKDNYNEGGNIKLNIDEISKNDSHYINIIICYLNYIYDVKTLSKNYLIGCNFLIKNEKIIPSYKIDYEEGFKFKKFIRDSIKKKFKFKNSDILHIKTVNNSKYNHNYLVLIDNNKNNIIKFKNMIHNNDKNEFCWRSIYNIHYPTKKNALKREIFDDLSNNATYKFMFENENKKKFNICDVYKSLSLII